MFVINLSLSAGRKPVRLGYWRKGPCLYSELGALDAKFRLGDFRRMSTVSSRTTKSSPRKPRARTKSRTVNKGPSFGEWARRVAGMIKGAPSNLSTREGFGD